MTSSAKEEMSLPDKLPILPISGIVLIPGSHLPLNIFEPRYTAMIEDCLGQNRMVGLIQPSAEPTERHPTPLYKIGCAGKITSFTETDDHRFLLTLQGICRFEIMAEEPASKGYRTVKPDWKNFVKDLSNSNKDIEIDRTYLSTLLRSTFKTLGINVDWDMIIGANNADLMGALAMICPLEPNEKQALLEAATPSDRAEMLISLLEMASLNKNTHDKPRH